jgi:hypothetical protein
VSATETEACKVKMLFLILDLALPVAVFLLARGACFRGKKRLMRDCILVFFLALLTSPIAFTYYSLSAQGILCAVLLLILSTCLCTVFYRKKTPEKQ